jgi:hypothetical protein
MSKAVYNAPFGLLVTQEDVTLDDQRIICLPLPSLLSLY